MLIKALTHREKGLLFTLFFNCVKCILRFSLRRIEGFKLHRYEA